MKSNQSGVIERLQQAQNAHDLEALLACFAPARTTGFGESKSYPSPDAD